MMRVLKEIVNQLFNRKKLKPVTITVYKTRAQIIAEGRGTYICRRTRENNSITL